VISSSPVIPVGAFVNTAWRAGAATGRRAAACRRVDL